MVERPSLARTIRIDPCVGQRRDPAGHEYRCLVRSGESIQRRRRRRLRLHQLLFRRADWGDQPAAAGVALQPLCEHAGELDAAIANGDPVPVSVDSLNKNLGVYFTTL